MDQVAQVREKIDLVTIISEYIPLKKMGNNFKANCPFHNEKTPSFVVSPERQIWHCFGCAKGGDAFTFLMEYEHVEFSESLRILAKRAGIQLTYSAIDTGITSKKEKIYEINRLASEYYHYVLTKHSAGKKALEYVTKRIKNDSVLSTFLIGFAPRGNGLCNYLLKKKGYKKDELIDAGLATIRGNSMSDFFSHRIIFPLFDHRDNVIGFAGRILDDGQSFGPKYMNTRDTLAYHKGETFFGIQVTKEHIKKENQAILVEGEFDVISCFTVGISNVLAIKGTALTATQAQLLSRFVQKVTICFDGDAAGKEAIKRSLSVLEAKGLTTTVIVIPNGKDPDEAIKNDEYAFKKAVKNDINIYDYLLDEALRSNDKNSSIGKKRITDELLPVYAGIGNEIVKEHYLKKLSNEVDTSYESITREIEKRKTVSVVSKKVTNAKAKKSREEILEEYLLSLIVQSKRPKRMLQKSIKILSGVMSKERAYQKILYHLLDHFEKSDTFDGIAFSNTLPSELLPAFNTSSLFPLPQFQSEDKYELDIVRVANELKEHYVRSKIKVLAEKMKEKEKDGKIQELEELQSEYTKLISQLQV
jgi:DNA primase